jgi:hypothetical protein
MTVKVGSLRWNDPDRFNGYGLSPRSADTPAGYSVSGRSIVVKRLGWWIIDVAVGSMNEPALAGRCGGTVGVLRLAPQLFDRAQVTGGRSVLRIEGFKHSNLKTGAPNEREAHQPAAPAHAR